MSSEKKICFLLSGDEAADVLEHVYLLCRHFTEYCDVTVIAPTHMAHIGSRFYEKMTKANVQLCILHTDKTTSSKALKEVKNILSDLKISIIHTHDDKAARCVTLLNSPKFSLKHINTVFSYYPYKGIGGLKKISKNRILKNCDRTVFVTRHCQEIMLGSYAIQNPIVIYPGAEECKDLVSSNNADDQIVLFVGPLLRSSGCIDLLKAFSLMCTGRSNLKLHIIGRGPLYEELSKIAQTLRIAEKVIISDQVSDVSEQYKGASVFVLPTYLEIISQSLITAMSYQKPIVTSNTQSHREYFADNASAVLVKHGDVFQYAMAIKKILDDQTHADDLKSRVKEKFKKCFLANQMIEKHKMLYKMV